MQKFLPNATLMLMAFSLVGCEQISHFFNTNNNSTAHSTVGYIEGDYRYLAAPRSGWLKSVTVNLGDTLHRGQLAFNYRSDAEQFAVNQADAQLQSQIAQSQNLTTGARPEEIASLQAQFKAAQAQLLLAKQTLERYQMLQRSDAVAQVQVDEMVAQVKTAQASVDSIQAQIRAANLPARKQTLTASIATSKAAKAALEKAQYDLSQLNVNSELAGEVSQVYYHTGEYVTQGQPIVQILPHANRKVIFYVPQDKLSTLRVGQVVKLQSIASQQPLLNATINYISPQASYTPPVIYSNENADKLTFRVEGLLNSTGNTPNLQVGQPVQVMFE
ncbi:Secretion protein HlyD [Enhydrobacter sp. AX1]|nr:HlyD family efflux transporter periplasmic adaptor subunit [Enhydrobacter sp. AX1]VXB68075.1 Secretion protein HlyD [Enhydrobacter sp. AX1]